MTAQRGRDLLLKIDLDGAGNFETIAGIRTKTCRINGGTIETTDSDSPDQWRELLVGGGVRSMTISGQGVFKDADSDATLREFAFNGALALCEIIFPDFGMMSGAFQVTALEYTGVYNTEITFETTLESAGQIIFEAEALNG